MGIITSIFRKKKDVIEVLEGLDEEITSLENRKRQNLDLQKRVIGSLILYSIIFYITGAIIFFVYYFPDTWKYRFLYSLPLLTFPFLIFALKRILHWYFVQRISHNDKKLRVLREKKKKMLEDVMEKETYKKAMKILERFDPLRFNRMDIEGPPRSQQSSRQSSPEPRNGAQNPNSELRFRGSQPPSTFAAPGTTAGPRPPLPLSRHPQTSSSTPIIGPNPTPGPRPPGMIRPTMQTPLGRGIGPGPMRIRPGMTPAGRGTPMPPQLARPILPRERTAMDKVIDLLIGDGPERRYALICANCSSHNGMALQEEFEYLSFRCCYCGLMNPARKMRPRPPAELFSQNSVSSSVDPSCEEEEEEEEDITPTSNVEADKRNTPPPSSLENSRRSSAEPDKPANDQTREMTSGEGRAAEKIVTE